MSGSHTYSNPGILELLDPNGNPPILENFSNNSPVTITNKLTCSVSSYNWGTARCGVKAFKGRWYYEVKIVSSGSARLGWATQNYAPESSYDGAGSDSDSYGWDGSKKTIHFDDKKSGKSGGTPYGDYWNTNDYIGCLLDFDNLCMSYTKNGKSMGVAFKNIKIINPFLPCVSVYRGAKIEINLGPTFKHQPLGFYGMNATVSAAQKKSLLNVFLQYHKKGAHLSESLSRDVIKPQGVLALGNDLGAKDPMDPHLLLLAWKMRSKAFFSFQDHEWMVLWANENVTSFNEMKSAVERWRKDISTNDDNFVSFYMFVFDYLRAQDGETKSSLPKDDAIMAWKMLGMDKKFHFWAQWAKFWAENKLLGVPRDTWIILLKFIDRVGSDVKNYSEDDCWPLVFDDFVEDYLRK